MRTYAKRKQNKCVAWESIENKLKTKVLRQKFKKTYGNQGFELEPMDNASKTKVLRVSLWKMQRNYNLAWESIEI